VRSPLWGLGRELGAIDRRRFLAVGGGSVAAALLAACNSKGPASAERLLRYAERKNEGVERWLLRHDSMDRAPAGAAAAGARFPSYYIAPTVPVWDAAARGPWALEVSGAVRRPLRLSLDDLQRLPRISQRVNH
jgi:DMSO/TMAO reductase YedYZ molybdopterin-dependent catalytic subunit